jgi:hypothetical protein
LSYGDGDREREREREKYQDIRGKIGKQLLVNLLFTRGGQRGKQPPIDVARGVA